MFQDTYAQPGLSDAVKQNLLSNFNDNWGYRVLDNSSDPLNIVDVTQGHNYLVPKMQPSNNAPEYSDVLVFPAANTAPGSTYVGFHLSDCVAFVERCKAANRWPTINHTGVGAVA